MENVYEDMIKRLSSYRKAHKISQKTLGGMMHITQSHYSKIEKGEKIMSGKELGLLGEKGIDIDYMISGEYAEKSILDEIMDHCPTDKKAELFQLLVWTVYQGISTEENKEKISESCIRELELLRCRTSPHIRERTIWFKIRKANQMTQIQMAEVLGLNVKYYRELEKGHAKANAEILAVLYKKLGYLPSVVFENTSKNLTVLNRIWNSLEKETREKMEKVIRAGSVLIS